MKIKKVLLLLVALLICVATVGCGSKTPQEDLPVEGGQKPAKAVVVEFWMYGDDVEMEVYKQLVSEFNKANKGYVTIKLVQKSPDSYSNALNMVLNGKKGPDLFYVGETGFKAMAEAGYLYDISEFVENSTEYDISKMWDSAVSRFQYDVNTKTNDGPNKKYYAVPKDIGPTVIYYNESLFNGSGVNVISVAKENLEAFNHEGAKDSRGKTKAEYGISGEVKEKGYFVDAAGKKWFNNQVAMNWEETVALSEVIQKKYPSTKGFYTEWWFNYGWSVGGDVIQYIPTDDSTYAGGYWDFTLMDPSKNYIVADDAEPFTINGNTYQPGEVLSYQDKLVNETPTVAGQKDETAKIIEPAVLAAKAAGQLNELPSQREAFVEFVRLAATKNTVVDTVNGEKLYGYEVTPYPNSIGGDAGKTAAFATGKVAMLVDGRWNVTNFREQMDGKYEWDVAPLPIYKEYDSEGNVAVHGVTAGHSGSVGVAINAKTEVPNAAWKFLEYIGGEYGQSVQSKTGFAIPLQKHLAYDDEIFLQSNQNPRNAIIFIEAAENEKAGDWWYLRDNEWINDWANLLNGSVRNGQKTLTEFYNSDEFSKTYGTLLKYTEK